MSRRLEKLIEQKAWETLTDYGYNDAHLLEQLTESVLERLANLDEGGHIGAGKQVMNPLSAKPDVLGFSRGGGLGNQTQAPTSGIDPDLASGGRKPSMPEGLRGIPGSLKGKGKIIDGPGGSLIYRVPLPSGGFIEYRWSQSEGRWIKLRRI